jgi:putative tricarboxylic transport membrane protein
MEGMELLYNGFIQCLTFANLMACFLGVFLGTLVGVLPGLGPTATMALILPFTLMHGPTTSLIMLTGVWYGAMYGGSTSAILVNIPGEAASVVTCIDGYEMCKKGRAGAALALVAVGSFIAGTIGIIGLQLFGPALGNAALFFGPPEYLAFMVLAFILLSNLSGDDPIKGFLMLGLGLFICSIGINPMDSFPRFTFKSYLLLAGIEFLPVAMGLFGVTEILDTAVMPAVIRKVEKLRLAQLYPSREEIKRSIFPFFRRSITGFFLGLLPGPCTVISTFVSYSMEKRISKRPDEFGHGAVEGVVAPEAANNSAVMGGMIPLLALGIPFAAPCAVMLAGLRMNNIEPGPLLFSNNADLFWTFIAAMYIGNFMLLVLNLPLVGFWGKVAQIRSQVLIPFVSLVCLIGMYSVRNSMFDVWIMLMAGVIGYFLRRWKFPAAPLVIGVVLGPVIENNLRQSLMLFKGDLFLIIYRPIAMVFLSLAILFIGYRVLLLFLGKKLTPQISSDE